MHDGDIEPSYEVVSSSWVGGGHLDVTRSGSGVETSPRHIVIFRGGGFLW